LKNIGTFFFPNLDSLNIKAAPAIRVIAGAAFIISRFAERPPCVKGAVAIGDWGIVWKNDSPSVIFTENDTSPYTGEAKSFHIPAMRSCP
jgi:hypothetical protein